MADHDNAFGRAQIPMRLLRQPTAAEISVHQSPRSRRASTHAVIRARSFAG
jgi:hypothetical protein